MNLKEKLEEILKNKKTESDSFGQDLTLYGSEQLESYKQTLLETETFKDCSELNFLTHPVTYVSEVPAIAQSIKWSEGLKLKGKCYLLSLALTPEMYNPSMLRTPVKDGAAITPTTYNQTTFEPRKKIVLEFSPERIQDGITNHEAVIRQELHDLLDKVFDNPKDYQIKGERGLLIRGVFETVEQDDKVTTVDLSEVYSTEPKHFMVFYLEPKTSGNNVDMNLKKFLVPLKLKDKFMEKYGDKVSDLSIKKEEIEEFLFENDK